MRVAALYDIHGNLPALDAVLAEVREARVDAIVVGGDVLPGPLPRETLDRLLSLDVPTRFLYGNGDRAVLAQLTAADPEAVAYWGTSGNAPLPEPFKEIIRWTARQTAEYQQHLASWPFTVSSEIPWLGRVLFCHATPRNEVEIFTSATAEARLLPLFAHLDAAVVVCGHTHMPFDRMVGRTRVVNAGSVGMPFGRTGADWLLLGPDVEPRHTDYDLQAAAACIRATSYPHAEELVAGYILQTPPQEPILAAYATVELT
jgi:predicted phosphodiesterase